MLTAHKYEDKEGEGRHGVVTRALLVLGCILFYKLSIYVSITLPGVAKQLLNFGSI